ncbi:C2H2 type zinc finger containing protein [Pseudozyma hubeiensis SY62]|uniref:C2H2 type zinc finger containing protein n=1 Tax=Pseudozyma hubeiensis (strain SY62) TaxID=1305764 RepID=R9NZE3_PSEHS|nr:C2H2 type zinc finger containing protein [Pseudozyma hubeiensis SY62]GAC94077.1 C2H2 type zinc finger containing protein [Pseudozyma hubeiensis SY62]
MRAGYATRSSTGCLPRNFNVTSQAMTATGLFSVGSMAHNSGNGGSMVRKRRRRYGPKPDPPYQCFCGKIFKRHEHMLRHRATHDDTIKYECHMCGKSFRRQDVMHRHTMTHAARSRQSSKLRNTASESGTAMPAAVTAKAAGLDQGGGGDKTTLLAAHRQRDQSQKQAQLGIQGISNEHDMLEDPTLRVGLGDYASDSSSSQHNQDHHIAAAQLYNACSNARYTFPAYAVNLQPVYANSSGVDAGGAGYARSDGFEMTSDYHARKFSSASPPPAFFGGAPNLGPQGFEAGQLGGATMPRAQSMLPMLTMATGHEHDAKHNGQDGGHHCAASWHAGNYGLAQGITQAGPAESEWSEQSPSGPSPLTFASPAWSQKGEQFRREGTTSASNGTPLGLSTSSRQLSMDPGARWHPYSEHQQQPQPPVQQQHLSLQSHYQQGSPLNGSTSDAGFGSVHRSPAGVVRRLLSGLHHPNGYSTAISDAQSYAGHGAQGKMEAHGGTATVGLGLGLVAQSHVETQAGSLGLMGTPTLNNAAANNGSRGDRVPALHQTSASPQVSNGTMLSSSSTASSNHCLDIGMSSMRVSQDTLHHNSPSYGTEAKHGFTSMSSVLGPFDSNSPLTEATGNASPHSYGNGQGRGYAVNAPLHVQAHRASSGPPIDPHLAASNNGYATDSSAASLPGASGFRRW